ncbi:MAG: holo-ACP synthase, partial [Gemmataceae bacterium]
AVFKALGRPWRKGMEWTDIEIIHDLGTNPQVVLAGATSDMAQQMRVGSILLSLAHCRAYATAHAIAIRE